MNKHNFIFGRKRGIFLIFLCFIFSISLVLGLPNDANNRIDFSYSTSVNYSLVNVNNSQYLQGYTPTTLYNYFKSLFDSVYQPIGNYLTTWLVPDTINGYLYNDSTKIYFNESKLITYYYNATTNTTIRGTPLGHIEYLQVYDSITYNVTEASGAEGLDFRVNFTGVSDFNQFIVRYKSVASESHTMSFQIYDYDSSSWENYATFSNVPDFNVKEIGVYDADTHISGGVVQVRFYQAENGNTNHIHYFDWVTIADGFATPSGTEIDPYSWHRNIQTESGNFTTSGTVTTSSINATGNSSIAGIKFWENATSSFMGRI